MTTETLKPQKNENEGLFSFLTAVIKKGVESSEGNVSALIKGVGVLTDEVRMLAESVSKLARTVYDHHITIAEILTVQEFILKNIEASRSESLSKILDVSKNKQQKPN